MALTQEFVLPPEDTHGAETRIPPALLGVLALVYEREMNLLDIHAYMGDLLVANQARLRPSRDDPAVDVLPVIIEPSYKGELGRQEDDSIKLSFVAEEAPVPSLFGATAKARKVTTFHLKGRRAEMTEQVFDTDSGYLMKKRERRFSRRLVKGLHSLIQDGDFHLDY